MTICVNMQDKTYDVHVERGAINSEKYFSKTERTGNTLVVTDDGVPQSYVQKVASYFSAPVVVILPQGEATKSAENYLYLLQTMLKNGFTRHDRVIAVGGGVVGDLSAFAASTYMRGIDFYNVPTTFLSQIDSCVGGKTAIDLCGTKNVAGTFYPPRGVIVDPQLLSTLPKRQLHAGIAEAIKAGLTGDPTLFALLKDAENFERNAETIVEKALRFKKSVVEADPKEIGIRKVLNFGHTAGHAIESEYRGDLLHGECVALGMIPFVSARVKEELLPVLEKYELPTKISFSKEIFLSYLSHDKKTSEKKEIETVQCDEIGTYYFKKRTPEEILRLSEVLL